ncbi:hypothetical protein LEP1GSC171_2749 [Leptospira santarosai str. HAI1380]|uniref:Uncharacterized protein n=2 Tax=Leptospira santarosai TaxID=28183 RepID=M6UQN3_9LEPT|nr:hypothetical protein LEP1GSC179_1865 [Leptospira santarosai str. MOR084]EKO78521.1 hypothetical protein LEP1GSC068_1395 [Leptospira sp. Fiocruz LV3954]EMI64335.1 hypothetical protein LEP1GSC076_2929 [Leptospira sp. Fiocruz LV4135]EMM76397.1 hypothetical protein LEP1GSC040_1180 [Leptospira santarosai str. 2000030832]EMO32848.1 hypothetical protein LEP1GSC175_1405 [Leptospira santarosai str. HAI821]EMO45071.1 hypothetical protein LEP1GSC187_1814 [Leptospira santarosai str. ZUN179]EMP03122.1 
MESSLPILFIRKNFESRFKNKLVSDLRKNFRFVVLSIFFPSNLLKNLPQNPVV